MKEQTKTNLQKPTAKTLKSTQAAPRKKAKQVKTLFNQDNYLMYLKLIKNLKQPYQLTRTNYTLKIESKSVNIYFMQNVMSSKAFICGAMVKKDLANSGMEMPEIDKRELKYFDFNIPEIISNNRTDLYNIDIKSAYANALNSNKLLQPKTYAYLCSLSKSDRLAAIGLLASSKDLISYDENDVCTSFEKVEKETANWFYFCVLEIQKLMLEIMSEIGTEFLFYWVDGIYFRGYHNKDKIEEIIKRKGYNNSFEKIYNLKYKEFKSEKVLFYQRLKDGEIENKRLNLPTINKEANNKILKLFKIIN